MPERLDLGDLGEEAVPAQVEAPAVPHHGAADAAHHVVGLEHDGVLTPLGQQIGRRQAPGTRAGDDDGCVGGAGHEEARLVDPPVHLAGGRRRARRPDPAAGQGTEMLRNGEERRSRPERLTAG